MRPTTGTLPLYPALCSAKELGTRLLREGQKCGATGGAPGRESALPSVSGEEYSLDIPFYRLANDLSSVVV